VCAQAARISCASAVAQSSEAAFHSNVYSAADSCCEYAESVTAAGAVGTPVQLAKESSIISSVTLLAFAACLTNTGMIVFSETHSVVSCQWVVICY
jgi:hypothetical protein